MEESDNSNDSNDICILGVESNTTVSRPSTSRGNILPTDEEWKTLEQTMHALQPLADLTIFLSGSSYVTGSALQPMLVALKRGLRTHPFGTLAHVKRGKDVILGYISKYYDGECSDTLNIMTYLDPRFKSFGHSIASKPKTELSVLGKLKEVVAARKASGAATPADASVPSSLESGGLGALLADMFSIVGTPDTKTTDEIANMEMAEYQRVAGQGINANPLEWWKFHQEGLPNLSQLAKSYLCIEATSVPSECLFSIAGEIVSENLNRLLPENVGMLGFLHDNLTKPHLPQYQRLWSTCYCSMCRKLIKDQGMADNGDAN